MKKKTVKKTATNPTSKKKAAKKKPRKRSRAGVRSKDASGLTASQRTFLKVFAEMGKVSAAAEVMGVTRQQHYVWYKENTTYKKRFDEALEVYNALDSDLVLEEVNKRAYDGWDEETLVEERETVVVKNEAGQDELKTVPKKIRRTKVHKFSITALLWKANFRHGNPQRLEVTGQGGGPIEVRNPLTTALEEMWPKVDEVRAAATKQIASMLPAVPVNGPVDGKGQT